MRGERFLSHASYLRGRYGGPVHRIAVDAGFSCPHRGNSRSGPGCSFCDEPGGRAPYLGDLSSVDGQIRRAVAFNQRRYGPSELALYFQAYTGTFASVDLLRGIYDRGLAHAAFRELVVATRPDCIDEAVAALLADYRTADRDVWVELGLQSASDETLRRVNRGHTVAEFETAYHLLRRRSLRLTVHLILGLPGEDEEQIERSLRYVAGLRPDGLKIHNLHVPRATALHDEFLAGELTVPGPERHLELAIRAIELMPPQTVIMRLLCDTPAARLVAPRCFWDKAAFHRRLRGELERRGTWQGRRFT